MSVASSFHFGEEAQSPAPTPAPSPTAGAQPRVLLVEPRKDISRTLLNELCTAGIDCRFAPDAAAASHAAHEAHPHLVVFGGHPGEPARHALTALKRATSAPIVVLCHDAATRNQWSAHPVDGVELLVQPHDTSHLVREIERRLAQACGGKAFFAAEQAANRVAPPANWGVCRGCGYMGPRPKFANPNKLAAHSLQCPACHHSENIEFSLD